MVPNIGDLLPQHLEASKTWAKLGVVVKDRKTRRLVMMRGGRGNFCRALWALFTRGGQIIWGFGVELGRGAGFPVLQYLRYLMQQGLPSVGAVVWEVSVVFNAPTI